MHKEWYLKTWFICLLFASWWMCGLPLLAGIFLLVRHQSIYKEYEKKYGDCDQVTNSLERLRANFQENKEKFENSKAVYKEKIKQLEREIALFKKEIDLLKKESLNAEREVIASQYAYSDYSALTSEECKNKLTMLKSDEKEFIKGDNAFLVKSQATKKIINDNLKQILRCFNSECDNVLVNLSAKKIDASRNKISKSFESLNTVFKSDGIAMNRRLLEYKLEELNLVYTYELKREQEREQQKAIKEQMVEEEKVRREIEKQKAKLEKDQAQCRGEIDKLIRYLQKTANEIEKQLYIDKIKELEARLLELEAEKGIVLEREANARAGYVYIISNIGSFGDDIYKIGMTRRLEPMDRVKELGSASVPFEFDVHAMIFSDDAPTLETNLHQHFRESEVNKINPRKEFFKVNLEEIEKLVLEKYNGTVQFTKVAKAEQYRRSLEIANQK